jgi:Ca2+-transporting ATPase
MEWVLSNAGKYNSIEYVQVYGDINQFMISPNTTECRQLVIPVHNRVAGRLRVHIPSLYRSVAIRDQLEEALSRLDVIHKISTSTRTANVLLLYSSETSASEVLEVLEALLAKTPAKKKKTVGRGRAKKSQNIHASLRSVFSGLETIAAEQLRLNNFRKTLSKFFDHKTSSRVDTAHAVAIRSASGHTWHQDEMQTILQSLSIDHDQGLTQWDAVQRLKTYGLNSLVGRERRSDWSILLEQINSLPVALLGASSVISIMTGGFLDAAIILGVVAINSAIGFVTERQAEITISSLDKVEIDTVPVIRDGEVMFVSIETIVPGDVLKLNPGTYIAADVRLLETHRLTIDESAMTGESLPVKKDHQFVASANTPLGDRKNMAYMGTHVTGGSGRGLVVATGAGTELGHIQSLVGSAETPDTPLEKQLDDMSTRLALLSGAVCAGVFVVGLIRGYSMLEMLKSSVSLAVAAVPEGLPAVATTTLALGIKDMRQHKAAVRHLDAVETLGSVEVVCFDKTGTLTENRMQVVAMNCGNDDITIRGSQFERDNNQPCLMMAREDIRRLLEVAALCNETELKVRDEGLDLAGSATEVALMQMAIDAGLDVVEFRARHPMIRTRYRADNRPYMTTLHPLVDGQFLLATKGRPAEVLELCDRYWSDGAIIPLNDEARQEILVANEHMAGEALRVLGFAYCYRDKGTMPRKTEGLIWLGLAGMADPVREGMPALMQQFHRAGIRTVMITGDQTATAQAIGRQLNLSNGEPLRVLEASRIQEIDEELLVGMANDVHVFSRVSPAHKLIIVQALQKSGQVVAMTGDGINDSPALKAANIGAAMGIAGTDIAHSVSDVVLEDDNLHTLSVATRKGRTIYDNIQKTIHFMVATNLTEIKMMLGGTALGLGQPLNSMQLLWINLVTDIFPGLALSMEPPDAGVMERPPRDPAEAVISNRDLGRMFFESSMITAGSMAAYLYGVKRYGIGPQASMMAFSSLTFAELAHALGSRSKYRTIFTDLQRPPNRHLDQALIGTMGAQGLATVFPPLRQLLGGAPLGVVDMGVLALSIAGPWFINEFTKPEFRIDDEMPEQDETAQTEEKG